MPRSRHSTIQFARMWCHKGFFVWGPSAPTGLAASKALGYLAAGVFGPHGWLRPLYKLVRQPQQQTHDDRQRVRRGAAMKSPGH